MILHFQKKIVSEAENEVVENENIYLRLNLQIQERGGKEKINRIKPNYHI